MMDGSREGGDWKAQQVSCHHGHQWLFPLGQRMQTAFAKGVCKLLLPVGNWHWDGVSGCLQLPALQNPSPCAVGMALPALLQQCFI